MQRIFKSIFNYDTQGVFEADCLDLFAKFDQIFETGKLLFQISPRFLLRQSLDFELQLSKVFTSLLFLLHFLNSDITSFAMTVEAVVTHLRPSLLLVSRPEASVADGELLPCSNISNCPNILSPDLQVGVPEVLCVWLTGVVEPGEAEEDPVVIGVGQPGGVQRKSSNQIQTNKGKVLIRYKQTKERF